MKIRTVLIYISPLKPRSLLAAGTRPPSSYSFLLSFSCSCCGLVFFVSSSLFLILFFFLVGCLTRYLFQSCFLLLVYFSCSSCWLILFCVLSSHSVLLSGCRSRIFICYFSLSCFFVHCLCFLCNLVCISRVVVLVVVDCFPCCSFVFYFPSSALFCFA